MRYSETHPQYNLDRFRTNRNFFEKTNKMRPSATFCNHPFSNDLHCAILTYQVQSASMLIWFEQIFSAWSFFIYLFKFIPNLINLKKNCIYPFTLFFNETHHDIHYNLCSIWLAKWFLRILLQNVQISERLVAEGRGWSHSLYFFTQFWLLINFFQSA